MSESTRRALDTWSEGFEASLELIERTEHSLWVVNHDLSGLLPERGDFPDALLRCLRRLPAERIHLVMRDVTPLLTRMPRMRRHLVDYAHVASVRQAAPHHVKDMDRCIMISDARHVLMRTRYDHPRAFVSFDDPAAAATELPQIETIWHAASNANIGAVLGL
jgi:hypothetical protein